MAMSSGIRKPAFSIAAMAPMAIWSLVQRQQPLHRYLAVVEEEIRLGQVILPSVKANILEPDAIAEQALSSNRMRQGRVDSRDPAPAGRVQVTDCFESPADVVGRDVAKSRCETDVIDTDTGDPCLEQPGHPQIISGETVQDDTADAAVAAAAKVGIRVGIDGGEKEQIAAARTQARLDALEQSEKDRMRAVCVFPGDRRHADHRRRGALRSHLFRGQRVGSFAEELSLLRFLLDCSENCGCRMAHVLEIDRL